MAWENYDRTAMPPERIESARERVTRPALEAFWSISGEAVFSLTPDATVEDANPAALALFNEDEDVIGRHLDWLVDRGVGAAPSTAHLTAAEMAVSVQRAATRPRWSIRRSVVQTVMLPQFVELAAADGGMLLVLRRPPTIETDPRDADPLALALEQIVRGTTEAVVVIDANQTIAHFNPGAERLFGWSNEAAVGQPLEILLPPDVRHAHAGYVKAFMAGQDAVRWMNDRADVTAVRADGSTFLAEATIVSGEGASGRFYAAVLRDVTERRDYEARLQESVRDLKQARYAAEVANRAKSEFVASISHELRTPLNAVIGFAHIMRSELHGPLGSHRYAAYAADIEESAQRLLLLVGDILDVSRLEAGQVELAPESVALDDLLASCKRLIAPRAAERGVYLHADPGVQPTKLFVDPRFMKQVLVNLLANAVKFTEEGGRVHLSATRTSSGGVRLRIADTGIGIPPEQLERIFEPFVQADGSLARRFEGSGLGLVLVRALIELHGGQVSMESQPGVGTTATVVLPPSAVVDPPIGD